MTYTARQRLLLRVVPPVATAVIHALCITLRFETVAAVGAVPADKTAGVGLYAFWHRSLLLAAWRYRGLGIRILISQSFDGELIARIVQRLGFVPVRGSSSRGGAAGLLALTRALHAGKKAAITVDGPRGPGGIAKAGAAAIALHAGQPLRPFDLQPDRAWTLKTWDRFLIPRPFTRVRCVWASPLLAKGTVPDLTAALQVSLEESVGH